MISSLSHSRSPRSYWFQSKGSTCSLKFLISGHCGRGWLRQQQSATSCSHPHVSKTIPFQFRQHCLPVNMNIDSDKENPIREATLQCRDLIQKCQELPEFAGGAWIEEQQADFNWWSHGLNATKTSHSSLDYRLRQRPDIQRVVLNHLDCISDALRECINMSMPRAGLINIFVRVLDTDKGGWLALGGDDSTSQELEDRTDFDDRIPSWSDSGSDASADDVSTQDDVPTTRRDQQKFYVQTQILLLSKLSLTIRRSGAKLRHQFADTALSVRSQHYDSLRQYLRWLLFRDSVASTGTASVEPPASSVDTLHKRWMLIENKTLSSVQSRLIEAVVVRRNRFEFAKSPWPMHEAGSNFAVAAEASKRKVVHNRVSSPQRNKVVKTSHFSDSDSPHMNRVLSSKASNKFRVESGSAIFSMTATAVGSDVPQMSDWVDNTDLASFATQITGTQMSCKDEYPPRPNVDQRGNSFRCPFCCQVLPKDTLDTGTKWR